MKDILKEAKGKISINPFRSIIAIAAIVYSIIAYKKNKNSKKIKLISAVVGVTGIALLAKEVESDFKPVDEVEDEE